MPSRLLYDNCAYVQKNKQSEEVGNYMFYAGKYYHDNQCRMELGQVGGNDVSIFKGNMVDLESDLRGITRDLSHCSENKYKPRCVYCSKCTTGGLPCGCVDCTKQNLAHLPNCQMVNLQRYTGIETPSNNVLDWFKSFF